MNICVGDLEDHDPDLTKSLLWMLDNSVNDLGLIFTYETDILGNCVTKELVPQGMDMSVDDTNKRKYVKLFCEMKMNQEIQEQIKAFLKGFRTILPKRFISHLRPAELELIISGSQTIDLVDMKENCTYPFICGILKFALFKKAYSSSDDMVNCFNLE